MAKKKIPGKWYLETAKVNTACTGCGRPIKRGSRVWVKYAGHAWSCRSKDCAPWKQD